MVLSPSANLVLTPDLLSIWIKIGFYFDVTARSAVVHLQWEITSVPDIPADFAAGNYGLNDMT